MREPLIYGLLPCVVGSRITDVSIRTGPERWVTYKSLTLGEDGGWFLDGGGRVGDPTTIVQFTVSNEHTTSTYTALSEPDHWNINIRPNGA